MKNDSRHRHTKNTGKRILVIDDDREILHSVRSVLEHRNFRVLTANDGNSGLAAAQRERPDLIILDMMMPKKSGFLILEKLKRDSNPPRMIMITANEGSRHRAYAEMLGVDCYLRKPFAMERLLEEVQRLTSLPPRGQEDQADGDSADDPQTASDGDTSASEQADKE